MPGGWITAVRGYDEDRSCLQLLEAQRSFCLRLRFAPNLCNELFIYSSAAEKRETEEVMVVRVVEGTEKLTKALEGNDMLDVSNMKIEAINCPALEAYTLVSDVVEGRKSWKGTSISELPVGRG